LRLHSPASHNPKKKNPLPEKKPITPPGLQKTDSRIAKHEPTPAALGRRDVASISAKFANFAQTTGCARRKNQN